MSRAAASSSAERLLQTQHSKEPLPASLHALCHPPHARHEQCQLSQVSDRRCSRIIFSILLAARCSLSLRSSSLFATLFICSHIMESFSRTVVTADDCN